MKKRFITILAVIAALSTAGFNTAQAVQVQPESSKNAGIVEQIDHRSAMETYRKQLEDYQKNLTAYQADPSIWTAEIPREPQRPEILVSSVHDSGVRSH